MHANRGLTRRQLVTAGLSAATLISLRKTSSAIQSTKNRLAVVIGVDQVGSLPKLKAAAAGAGSVAKWLDGEGFDVKLIDDRKRAVKVADVFDAVSEFVNRPTAEQLVIYFAGHGFVAQYSEYWLLSGAPDNPNEAVSVAETIVLAKQAPITNVVIISDACRSTADSLKTERVRGSLIFPNRGQAPSLVPDVDVLYATLVGDPSWEIPMQQSVTAYRAIFTDALLEAYKNPDASMINIVGGKQVVPNARLKKYLNREVPKRAQSASIQIVQRPDVQVVSDDTTYIGMVHRVAHPSNNETSPVSLPDLADIALQGAEQKVGERGPGAAVGWIPFGVDANDPRLLALQRLAVSSGFKDSVNHILYAPHDPDSLSAHTGFSVLGAKVRGIATVPESRTTIGNAGSFITVDLGTQSAATAAIRFSNGRGCVLAALSGYIGNVSVDEHGVFSVAYLPSRDNPLREAYIQDGARISELHAVVATSARFGVFRINGGRKNRKEAQRLGDEIRVFKSLDATLGLYAAYAYAMGDLIDDVRSVRNFVQDVYRADLWDIAMLSGGLSGDSRSARPALVPICPMLSQGWSLLRVKNIQMPSALILARDHLLPSLWTTFDSEGMDIVEKHLGAGAPV
jgi:hypothetical protein